jgi:hypothetical protein
VPLKTVAQTLAQLQQHHNQQLDTLVTAAAAAAAAAIQLQVAQGDCRYLLLMMTRAVHCDASPIHRIT